MTGSRLAMVVAVMVAAGLVPAPLAEARVGDPISVFGDPLGVEREGWTGITAGGDGNMWFTICDDNLVGRITPEGVITYFTEPGLECPGNITLGPDGNVWFQWLDEVPNATDVTRVGRITPEGEIDVFAVEAQDLTTGPDGDLWLAQLDSIARIDTDGQVTGQWDIDGVGEVLFAITAGPDGNLWFTDWGKARIGRITTGGTITMFSDPADNIQGLRDITSGPDGNLWFTSFTNDRVGRITPAGEITTFPIDAGEPHGITTGPDGNVWFAFEQNGVGRITTEGALSLFDVDAGDLQDPTNIAAGPDGAMWFTALGNLPAFAGGIGRVPVLNPGCNSSPPAAPFTDLPADPWYGPGLDWAACHEVVWGYPDMTYRPKDPVKRGQVANMVWTMVDVPGHGGVNPAHPFSDVPDDVWYEPALDWAAFAQVVSGFADGTYRPQEPLNRAQFVNLLWILAGQPDSSAPHGFWDVAPGVWYELALDWAAEHGLVTGFPDGNFYPKDPVNRGQVVAILDNLASDPTAWDAWDDGLVTTWRFDP